MTDRDRIPGLSAFVPNYDSAGTDGGAMHSDRGIAGLPSARDRDPVAEAVERGAVEWEDERARYHVERYGYVVRPYDADDLALARRFLRASLAAALAPYGGLDAAIRKLEEGK